MATWIIGDQAGDNYNNIIDAVTAYNALGTLTEPLIMEVRDIENLMKTATSVISLRGTTSAINTLTIRPVGGSSINKFRDGSAPKLSCEKGGTWGIFNIENGCNHFHISGLHLHANKSSTNHINDNRTIVPADADGVFDKCYGTLAVGATGVKSFNATEDTNNTRKIRITNSIIMSAQNGVVGRLNDKSGISIENCVFYNRNKATSYTGVYACKINNSAVFGYGTSAGYHNLFELDATSSHVATNDASGLSGLANVNIADCFHDPDNEGWWYGTKTGLVGKSSTSGDIANLTTVPPVLNPAFVGTPSIVANSITSSELDVTATSSTDAQLQILATSNSVTTRPADTAFDASSFKLRLKANEAGTLKITGLTQNSDLHIWPRLKPVNGTSAYGAAIATKTLRTPPTITSISGSAEFLTVGETVTVVGSGFDQYPEADTVKFNGADQGSYTKVSDTQITFVVTKPNFLKYGVVAELSIAGVKFSRKMQPGAAAKYVDILDVASSGVIVDTNNQPLERGDQVEYLHNNNTVEVLSNGTATSTNVPAATDIQVFSENTWGTTATINISQQTGNALPVIAEIANVTVERGKSQQITVNTSDADGDTVTLTVSGSSLATISGNVINIAATGSTPLGSSTVTVTANDGTGSSTQTFTINVIEAVVAPPANTSPTISSATSISVVAGQTLIYTGTSTDADAGDTVTISYSGLPAGATVANETVTWTPPESQSASIVSFNVTATDNKGGSTTEQVTVNIAATPSAVTVQARFTDTIEDKETSQLLNANNMTALLSQRGEAKGSATFNCVNGQVNVVIQDAIAGQKYSVLYEDSAGDNVGSTILTAQAV